MKGKNSLFNRSQEKHFRLFHKYIKQNGDLAERKTVYHWECYYRQWFDRRLLSREEKRAIWSYHKHDFNEKGEFMIPFLNPEIKRVGMRKSWRR